jgi:hypothetical protein
MNDANRISAERVRAQERTEWDVRDLEPINAHADELNAEVEDILGYQDAI